jgi:biopolymer transport protein ExbD/biopolymer transport protein TolR
MSGGRRRAKTRTLTIQPVRSVQAEINVTPLVDIVLVLLIIFMVATPLVEKDLAVSLSAEKHTEKAAEIQKEQVIVSLAGTGALRINADPVEPADFVEQIRRHLRGRAPEDKVVFIVAEDRAPYRTLVDAIDRAKMGGATTVGLPTETAF